MQFQEASLFFVNTKKLIEKVKEARLINVRSSVQIKSLTAELTELKRKENANLFNRESQFEEKIKELSNKLYEAETRLKQADNIVQIIESEKLSLNENFQKCQKEKVELELTLKARETESSLQISQTELALSRLTALRSQLSQLQNNNENIEDFIAKFKSSVSSVKLANQRSLYDNKIIMQNLTEKSNQIKILQEKVDKLLSEKEILKIQISLEDKISQHSKSICDEELRTFERMKQKIDTLFCTVEGTVTTAEHSGTLFMQLRTILNNLNKKKEFAAEEDSMEIEAIENDQEAIKPSIVESVEGNMEE